MFIQSVNCSVARTAFSGVTVFLPFEYLLCSYFVLPLLLSHLKFRSQDRTDKSHCNSMYHLRQSTSFPGLFPWIYLQGKSPGNEVAGAICFIQLFQKCARSVTMVSTEGVFLSSSRVLKGGWYILVSHSLTHSLTHSLNWHVFIIDEKIPCKFLSLCSL